VTDDMVIMQEEIFGPLLPVKTYRTLDEVIAYVNGKDRPLGFYVFTNDKATEEKLLYSTISAASRSTTACCTSPSTTCRSAGSARAASGTITGTRVPRVQQAPAVFTNPRLSLLHLFYPPYTAMTRRLLGLLIKYKR